MLYVAVCMYALHTCMHLHMLCMLHFLQAFCWLCGGATGRAHTWEHIENHSCGRFKEEAEERVSSHN